MKKIMYVVKYMPDDYNSVGDILNCIVDLPQMGKYEQLIVQCDGHSFCKTTVETVKNHRCYTAKILSIKAVISVSDIKLPEKIKLIFNKIKLFCLQKTNKGESFLNKTNEEYLDKIIKKEQPDLIVFFVYSPEEKFVRACKSNNVDYVYMLYDTFIDRPGISREDYLKEKYVVDNSKAYFVPGFFAEKYYEHYGNKKIIQFNLPLLIDIDSVKKAYKNPTKYEFTYFGQIQNFRNGEEIKKIFKTLDKSLDIFTTQDTCASDETFRFHSALTKDELFSVVAGSDFLVAFDNSAPYNMYLPSKAYLYVSFTKPVIVFGDNEKSAIKDFFSEYSKFYYQNINEPVDGLLEFLEKNKESCFDEGTYSEYLKYLPKNAMEIYSEKINNIIDN